MNFPVTALSRRALLSLAALGAGLLLTTPVVAAEPGKLIVQTDKPGARISPLLFGLMTEEINYSYEGGLYGELLPNRDFKGTGGATGGGGRGGRGGAPAPAPTEPVAGAPTPVQGAAHWGMIASDGAQGVAALDKDNPVPNTVLDTSLKLTITSVAAGGRVGITNDGFWGVPAKPNATYTASFWAKASDGFSGPLTVAIESNDGKTVQATATLPGITNEWKRYSITLKTGALTPSSTNRFVVSAAGKGTIHFTQVSLFPPVFNERTGAALGERPDTGFRPDIMQLLSDMKPAFLRFPGGNYVEGPNLAARYNFKTTIGPWEQRPGHEGSWSYRSSDGLGFMEYLEWCEDIHMEPVMAVWDGLNLNGGRGVITGDALKPYIQDALDEIQYVSGDATTEWGAKRAKDGHPAPFKLTYVEIGNEDNLNGGTQTYRGDGGRFDLFYKAIKEKYPNIQVIATTNPGVKHDVIDNHAYMSPSAAIRNAHQYDRTDRNGPRIFEGEWASQEQGGRRPLTPTFQCAISDAAFLTGLQRNADIVIMSCYAPLFTRVDPGGNQWQTNLIGYDTLTSYGSPPYYTQKMFNNARGDVVLPVASITPESVQAPASEPAPAPDAGGRGGRGGRGGGGAPNPNEPLFACASKEDATGDIILKVVNIFPVDQNITVSLEGATVLKNGTGQVMSGQPADTNSIAEPMHTIPKDFAITDAGSDWNHVFPGNSITVLRFKTH